MTGFDVVVIGAGAAGCLAAGTAAASDANVCLIERNAKIGRKLMITGKGRCNLTNNSQPEDFIRAVVSGDRFLRSALSRFSPADTIALFERQGVPLKTERGGRVFPVSDRAQDIVDALFRWLKRSGVTILHSGVRELEYSGGAVQKVLLEDGSALTGRCIIVATGGKSYPLTGSTGDGYRFAESAGHTIVPQRASLVPIETADSFCAECAGLTLKNVRLDLLGHGRKVPVFSEQGELLFTHFGVSGPLALSASARMTRPATEYTLSIDLKPALSCEILDRRILRDFAGSPNKDISNALGGLLPSALIIPVVRESGLAGNEKVHSLTREQRIRLGHTVKNLTLHPTALRPIDEAVVTAGGVNLREVDPKTMRSKLIGNLYFAGEVLDLDACTGGYNLQIAFSTGFAAGTAAAIQTKGES